MRAVREHIATGVVASGGSSAEGLDFQPSRWLRNAHVQSLLASVPPLPALVRRRAARLRAGSRELLLECGGQVRLQSFCCRCRVAHATGATRRLAVLLHGWEGSAESSPVLSLGAKLLANGYDVVRLNLRDHGRSHHLTREIFHSCRLAEVVGAVRCLAERLAPVQLFLAGFSLGGNFLLRVASDPQAPASIAGVVAVSPVLDPAMTLRALERGTRIYRRHFVRCWSRSLRAKQRAWPLLHDFEDIVKLGDLRRMTEGLVGRCAELASVEAYLGGYALTGERLAGLRFPARVLLAEDDPLIPAADLARLACSPLLAVRTTRYGGHCGFIERAGTPSFAERYVCAEFDSFALQAQPTHQAPQTRRS